MPKNLVIKKNNIIWNKSRKGYWNSKFHTFFCQLINYLWEFLIRYENENFRFFLNYQKSTTGLHSWKELVLNILKKTKWSHILVIIEWKYKSVSSPQQIQQSSIKNKKGKRGHT